MFCKERPPDRTHCGIGPCQDRRSCRSSTPPLRGPIPTGFPLRHQRLPSIPAQTQRRSIPGNGRIIPYFSGAMLKITTTLRGHYAPKQLSQPQLSLPHDRLCVWRGCRSCHGKLVLDARIASNMWYNPHIAICGLSGTMEICTPIARLQLFCSSF